MASFVASPNVAEFLDVVMHDRSIEFQMREFEVHPESSLAGKTLREINLREVSGALVMALRSPDGAFTTNPTGDSLVQPGHVIIAVGTIQDFERLSAFATPHR
jgi:voltage-gated potassium channel